MTESDFLQLHLHRTDYIKQLNVPFEDDELQKLQLLMEYHVLNQRKMIHELIQVRKVLVKDRTIEKNTGSNQCVARIHNGNQCSRKCKSNVHEFCGSHLHSLPYGRIDEKPLDINKLVEKKTRGRKSKNKTNIELDQIDLNNYIKTQIILIEGTEYLIDNNDIVFENDSSNTIVGRRINDDEYLWF